MNDNPFIIAIILSIIAYLLQAIVNIAQPNTTPLLFILLGILYSYLHYQIYE
jgi:hypothetical protein